MEYEFAADINLDWINRELAGINFIFIADYQLDSCDGETDILIDDIRFARVEFIDAAYADGHTARLRTNSQLLRVVGEALAGLLNQTDHDQSHLKQDIDDAIHAQRAIDADNCCAADEDYADYRGSL